MAIDPQAQAVLDLIRQSGSPPYETLPATAARELYLGARAIFSPDPPEVAEVHSLVASGPHGAIPMRLYRPLGSAAADVLPALVYYHGGGWVIGDLDSHDVVCRQLANRAGCAVISVDYRLAPEHKFPAAVDDAFAALLWVRSEAEALRIDATRLAIGGDSAGGNLSAVVALRARSAEIQGLRLQVLIYPATDFAGHYESQERLAEGHLLTRANQAWFRGLYLRDEADYSDWRASPLRAASLAGLPPAYVLTAGFDPLSDEGEAYAARLEAEGVTVTRRVFPGQIHGFITMGKAIGAAEIAITEAADAVKAAFAG
ncbi:MAG: alpha/beta hydrolase [Aliidongia sp.]